jgi:hypothetical protein
MKSSTDNTENDPVEVFRGTGWEVTLVQSLLANAEIESFLYFGALGTTATWDSRGCFPLSRIMVSSEDNEKAKEVINQYYQAMKE